jgi:hypothetical protein
MHWENEIPSSNGGLGSASQLARVMVLVSSKLQSANFGMWIEKRSPRWVPRNPPFAIAIR